MSDITCERPDGGACEFCGAKVDEDCPLTDLAPELAEWHSTPSAAPVCGTASDNEECEGCQ